MNDQEKEIFELLTQAWNKYNALEEKAQYDNMVFGLKIRDLQQIIMVRQVRRNNPEHFVAVEAYEQYKAAEAERIRIAQDNLEKLRMSPSPWTDAPGYLGDVTCTSYNSDLKLPDSPEPEYGHRF